MMERDTELTGDHPVEMYCSECDDTFMTDETVTNECPECGYNSMTATGNDGESEQ